MRFKLWLEGEGQPIPLANLLIPHHSINRIYQDRVNQYRGDPGTSLPTGVAESEEYDARYFSGWVKLTRAPVRPDFPRVYITDGVHRLIALKEGGAREALVRLTDRP